MTKEQLVLALNAIGIKPYRYSILGSLNPDTFVVENWHGVWKVFYYSEKGEFIDENYFLTENEAYEHLFKRFSDEEERINRSIRESKLMQQKDLD